MFHFKLNGKKKKSLFKSIINKSIIPKAQSNYIAVVCFSFILWFDISMFVSKAIQFRHFIFRFIDGSFCPLILIKFIDQIIKTDFFFSFIRNTNCAQHILISIMYIHLISFWFIKREHNIEHFFFYFYFWLASQKRKYFHFADINPMFGLYSIWKYS